MTKTRPQCRLCRTGETAFHAQVDGNGYSHCARCRCTLMDTAHLPAPATEEEQYRLHNNDVEDPGYRRFLARLVEPLAECLAPGAEGLDFGCGPGPVGAAMLREKGFTIAEYDPIFAPDPEVLQRDYDFILCSEVFEHFHHPARELDRLQALLRPGGWLGVMTQFDQPEQDFHSWHYRRDPTHVVFYRPETFACIARDRSWEAHFPADNVVLLHKPR